MQQKHWAEQVWGGGIASPAGVKGRRAFSRDLWPSAEHRPQSLLAMHLGYVTGLSGSISQQEVPTPRVRVKWENYKEYWTECLTHNEDSLSKRQEGSVILLSKQQCKAGYIIIPLLGIRKMTSQKDWKLSRSHTHLQTTGHQSQII